MQNRDKSPYWVDGFSLKENALVFVSMDSILDEVAIDGGMTMIIFCIAAGGGLGFVVSTVSSPLILFLKAL